LLEELGFSHSPEEWRPLVYVSKLSLKAVLLHSGNVKLLLPVAHSVAKKESYESMSLSLNDRLQGTPLAGMKGS
jgi:hypothetical protein